MKKREICELNFKLRTTSEVETEPGYTYTGGIEIKLKDGREYCLDFNETRSQSYEIVDGYLEVEVCQRDLNLEYIKESNEEMDLEEMTDIQFLKDNAVSIAIYFEAEGEEEEEEYESELEVTSCTFRAMNEAEEIDFSEITTLQ